ncbi:MAG: S-layer homology domain-containing protein [Actinomycetota bacterium]|nr:S-layer homology domain-containing protein [Actinomycetota bacterium]
MSVRKSPRARVIVILTLLSLLLPSIPASVFAVAGIEQPPGPPASAENPPATTQEPGIEPDTAPLAQELQVNTPAAPIIQPINAVNQHNVMTVTVAGSADSTTTIYITVLDIDGNATTATAQSNGTFSAQLDLSALKDGMLAFTAYAKNEAGQAGSISNAVFAIKDTKAPTGSISSPAPDSIINNNRPLVVYTVDEGTVVLKVDGLIVDKASGGTLDVLADGPHTLVAEAVDTAGNGSSAVSNFTVDTKAPVVTITSPQANATINDTTPRLEYTVGDGTVVVEVDGVVVSKTSGSDIDTLTPGPHTVKVKATDAAGNTGIAQATFTVNTQTPAVSSTDPPANATGIALGKTITVTLNDTITASAAYDAITLTAGSSQISISKSVSGKSLTIDPASDLSNNTSYTVTIPVNAVKNAVGAGLASAYAFSFTTVAAVPPVPPVGPQGLKIVSNKELIHLEWTPSTETSVTGYNIYRRLRGDASATKLNIASLSAAKYEDRSAQKSEVYIYYVTALYSGGLESAKSVEIEAALAVVEAIKAPSDIPADAPYKTAVDKLIAKGSFSVSADGKFYPDKNISRAEFAKAVYFIMGGKLTNPTKATFKDLSAQHWGYQYAETLNSYGVMIGYPDKTFRADKEITRAEVAKVVATVRKLPEAAGKLKDIGSSWAKTFIDACVKAGAMTGYSDNTFKPDNSVTRAEAAEALEDAVK